MGNQINQDHIKDVPVDLVFEIGRTEKDIKEIMKWKRGTPIKLDDSVVNQLNVFVNDELLAHGTVLKNKDGELSVQITKRLSR